MFWRNTKKEITDQVKKDRAKYDTMEKKVSASIATDMVAIDKVKRTQMELINVVEEHERQLAEIRDILGVKQNIGVSTSYSTQSEEMIIGTLDNTLSTCNLLQNLSEAEGIPEVRDALARMLCTFAQKEMDARFHKDLSTLEKCGMLSDEKYQRHMNAVGRTKLAVAAGTYALFDVAPIAIDYYRTKMKKDKWETFIIGSYAYINGELNPIMQRHICAQLQQAGLANSPQQALAILKRKFGEYINRSIELIPMLDNKVKSQLDILEAQSIAKNLVSHCDLQNPLIRERAGDVVSNFLRINQNATEQILMEAQDSQLYLSNLVSFSSRSFGVLFNDFIGSMQDAQEFVKYDINADIYKKHRDETKDTFDQMVRDVMSQSGIFMTAHKRADIIMVNAKMMERTLNPSIDFATTVKIMKRNQKVAEYMDVDYQRLK